MKIAVECQSQLLQKSLELFLSRYLTSIKNCDIVVRDSKCNGDAKCFYISTTADADLIKPFSKSQLILSLENRYKETKEEQHEELHREYSSMDFSILEKRIEIITKEYQDNILQAVRAFYEE